MNPQPHEHYRLSLPRHPDQHRTGAVLLPPDPRDYPAAWHPILKAGATPPADSMALLSLIKEPRLDQGATGACVAGSSEGNCQMAESAARGSWPSYSIPILYAEAGGTGNSGVDVRTVMKICIDKGTPLVDSSRDPVIKSYLFLDPTPGIFRSQVMTFIDAGHPVLVASLLPIPFGWNSGMVLSQGYHQYEGVAYQTDSAGKLWLILMNTWGDSWPGDAPPGTPAGVGRISFDALEQDGQRGYLYGVIPTNLTITPPPPPPPLAAAVTGRATAGLTNGVWPKVGDHVPFGQDVTLQVQTLVYDGSPQPDPNPTPVGDLKVILTLGRGRWLYASVLDAKTGEYLSATCHLTLNGVEMGVSNTTKQGETSLAARWYLGAKTGTVVVNASAAGERSGSATLAV